MSLDRRQFVLVAIAATAGCAAENRNKGSAVKVYGGRNNDIVDAGPIGVYAADGLYDRFQSHGFFVIRQGEKLTVVSSVCTHFTCMVSPEQDGTFRCRCHGSTFDPQGRVTQGPAVADLPVLPTQINGKGHLIVMDIPT